jgi:molybdopterin molybdotransferase
MDAPADARSKMLAHVRPVAPECVSLDAALGRTLAVDVVATRDQPPFRSSARDGYALRAADLPHQRLEVVGEASAGSRYAGALRTAQAVRIFTGAPVPDAADVVVAQESVRRTDPWIAIEASVQPGRNIRPRAGDFARGQTLVSAGVPLSPRHVALIAATGMDRVEVRREPRIAILTTGTELRLPGTEAGPDEIHDSLGHALAAFVSERGGEPLRLDAAPDASSAVAAAVESALSETDLVVVVGGASVGDHDVARGALGALGLEIDVARIAIRPGKPTWFGRIDGHPILGLPGNPAAALVCATVFLGALLDALLARSVAKGGAVAAVLDGKLEPCRGVETYLRARAGVDAAGRLTVRAFENQDTSLVSVFAASNALIRREPDAPGAASGDLVEVLLLDLPVLG